MAKRRKANKSAAIRNFLTENPQLKPKAICAALAEQGLKVTPAYVSMIKTNVKKSGGTVGVRKGRTAPSANGHRDMTFADLMLAKELADRLGGAKRARAALDALAKLV